MGNLCKGPAQVREPGGDPDFQGVSVRNPSVASAGQSSESESDGDVGRPQRRSSKKILRDPSCAKSGPLMKLTRAKRGGAPEWKRRHLELHGAVLRYFCKSRFRGQITLTGMNIVVEGAVVQLTRAGRATPVASFRAQSDAEARDWAVALHSATSVAAAAASPKAGATRSVAAARKKGRQVVFQQMGDPEETLAQMPEIRKSDGVARTLRAALQGHFLFSSIAGPTMRRIVGAMEEERVAPGEMIITEGEQGDKLYVLEKGAVQFIKGGQVVGSAGPGTLFGELALMYDCPRAASVRVDGPGVVWSLRREYFKALLATGATSEAVQRVNFLRRVALLEPLSDQQISRVADALNVETFRQGTRIVKQGAAGDKFFIIREGGVQVTQDRPGSSEQAVLVDLKEGDYFGELALMNDEPRKAHVTALTDVVCYTLEKVHFNQILGSLTDVLEVQNRVRLLRGMEIFKDLSERKLDKIANHLTLVQFANGQEVVREGETGSEFFIVFNGEASVLVGGKPVATLTKGMYFGERSLLKDEPRSATVRAQGRIEVFSMTRATFVRLLGPVDDALRSETQKRDMATARALGKAPAGGEEDEHEDASPIGPVSLRDLETLGTLGTGGFGTVKMVKHKKTGRVMALKILSKAHVKRKKQIGAVINEKRALQHLAGAPFVVRLYGSFQDANCLYLLLQIVPGGELWSAMYNEPSPLPRGRLGGLATEVALFYFLNVVLAMREVHTQGYAYRDLKPENLLVDGDGYLTMVDFGFAKRIPVTQSSFTLCGTPEYLAPELVLGRGHNQAADLWALGIFIYELLVGVTPFFSESQSDMFNKIINAHVTLVFPKNTPKEASNIIQQLLRVKPSTRLGMQRGGIDDLLQHPVFKPFNLDDMIARRVQSPWRPPVQGEADLTFFSGAEDDHPIEPYTGPQHEFKGF